MAEADPTTEPGKETGNEQPTPPNSKENTEQEKKAMLMMDQAREKVKSATGFMGKIFGGASKLEEAADLYTRAANQFKVAKNFERAGDCFTEAAQLHADKLDSRHEAANDYAEAAQVYKKAVPQNAVDCYIKAIEIYSDMGRFGLAARYYMNVAEIYESDIVDFEKAIVNYEQAADFYRGEDSNASANKCLAKVAHMSAQLQHFQKAAQLFEEIAKGCLDNGLLKYSAKDYFFKALVCWFCHHKNDVQPVSDKIQEYKALHPAFDGTRELKLIESLIEAFQEEDTDKFSEHIQDYDSISRIDNWLTAQLLYIKKNIDAEQDPN